MRRVKITMLANQGGGPAAANFMDLSEFQVYGRRRAGGRAQTESPTAGTSTTRQPSGSSKVSAPDRLPEGVLGRHRRSAPRLELSRNRIAALAVAEVEDEQVVAARGRSRAAGRVAGELEVQPRVREPEHHPV